MSETKTASEPLLVIAIAASAYTDHQELREHIVRAGLLDEPDVRVCVALQDNQSLEAHEDNLSVFRFTGHSPFFEQYAEIIQQTQSQYIALLDAACPPTPGWLTAVLQQIRNQTPIVFGPVNSGWADRDSRILGYLIEYAQFRAPIDPELPEFPGNNIAFQRELLRDVPMVGEGFQKTFFLRQVREKHGITPTACNDMLVTYLKQYRWGYYLQRRFSHGRLYGASHAEVLGTRRFLYAAGILILPLLRYSRILRAAKRTPALSPTVRHFSLSILISECAWSAGECAGYLAGAAKNGRFFD